MIVQRQVTYLSGANSPMAVAKRGVFPNGNGWVRICDTDSRPDSPAILLAPGQKYTLEVKVSDDGARLTIDDIINGAPPTSA